MDLYPITLSITGGFYLRFLEQLRIKLPNKPPESEVYQTTGRNSLVFHMCLS